VAKKLEDERTRIQRNAERREARERTKARAAGGGAASPPASTAGSPGPSDAEAAAGSANGTPQKSRGGRNKDGTARKCANCGQVGHIKTNRKLVSASFSCLHCGHHEKLKLDANGAVIEGAMKVKKGPSVKGAGSFAATEVSEIDF
jgi:hypothetical protein